VSKEKQELLFKALTGYIAILTTIIGIGSGLFYNTAANSLKALTEASNIDKEAHSAQNEINKKFEQQITELKTKRP